MLFSLQNAPNQAGSKAVTATYPIINLKIFIFPRDIKALSCHHAALPIIQQCRLHLPQRSSHNLHVRIRIHHLLRNAFVAHWVDKRKVFVGILCLYAHIALHGNVSVKELSQQFNVSVVTIRKDLDALAQKGILTRSFGGASITPPDAAPERPSLVAYKDEALLRSIAMQAAKLIENNDIVLINSSITASFIVEYLEGKQITIVTNNTEVLKRIPASNVTVILTGGQIHEGRTSLTGVYAGDALSKIIANKCVLGVRGISAAKGITSQVLEESFINQKMIQNTSGPVIVTAVGSKIGKEDSFYSGSIRNISYLITTDTADPQELDALRAVGLEIILASPDEMQ